MIMENISKNKISITIDEQEYTVNEGQMLIDVTDQLGIHIPRFCYHEKLSIAANCRMCLIDVENTVNPQPACATPVTNGMVIRTRSDKTQKAQQGTMEFLLINHPLDCPICDQAGECELQDLAYSYGGNQSRFEMIKQTKSNDNLGPLISTDMTRCILCTRCVRFADEVAGLPELGTIGRGDSSNISTYIESTIDHELSGNMIDLCPVGALNNKPYRYTERTWELDQIKSVSPHDCVGSNIQIHIKEGKIKRIVPKCNEDINEIWISDRDRFAFAGIYSNDRLYEPMIHQDGKLKECTWEDATKMFSSELITLRKEDKSNQIAGLISPSCTLDQQYLFSYLFNNLNCHNIDHRIQQVDFRGDSADCVLPMMEIKPHEIKNMDNILVIGSDIRKEVPIIAHWLRKAAIKGSTVNFINDQPGDYFFPIDNFVLSSSEALAENIGLVLKASLEENKIDLYADLIHSLQALSKPTSSHYQIAQSLVKGNQNLILSGLTANSHPEYSLIRNYLYVLSQITQSHKGELSHGANAIGAHILGCIPHRNAFGENREGGMNALEISTNNHEVLILYDIEPEDCLYVEELKQAIIGSKKVVYFTPYLNAFMEENADIVFPVNTAYESSGSFINVSGIVQNFTVGASQHINRPSNSDLLNNIISSLELPEVSTIDLDQKTKSFLDQSVSEKQTISELPTTNINKPENRLRTYSLYNVDSTVRRSIPLQETSDAKSLQPEEH